MSRDLRNIRADYGLSRPYLLKYIIVETLLADVYSNFATTQMHINLGVTSSLSE